MGEVKAQVVSVYQRSGLLNMGSQNLLQRCVKQMGSRMISCGKGTVLLINSKRYLLADGEHAGNHGSHMAYLAALKMDGVFHAEFALLGGDYAGISLLAAHGAVERSLLGDDGSLLAVGQCLHDLILCGKAGDDGVGSQCVIAHKSGGQRRIDLVIDRIVAAGQAVGSVKLPVLSCLLPLCCHGLLKALLIDAEALLLQNLSGEVDGEAVGIIELEGRLAAENLLALCIHLIFHIGQDLQTLIDGAVELVLLAGKHAEDHGLLLIQLRIAVLAELNHGRSQVCHELALDVDLSSVTGSSSKKSSEDIASSLVGGHNAVGDHEGAGLDVVRNDAEGHIGQRIMIVFLAAEGAYPVKQSPVGIDGVQGIGILHHHGQTLQTHAGINILVLQIGVVALAVVVELGEYDIPYLAETVAVAAYMAVRLAAAVLLASVIVNLGAGAAGTGAVLPEVIFLAEAVNALGRNSHLIMPDIPGFLVIQVDRRIQAVGIESYHLGQKFPCPRNRFILEIIAEGEIAQHLKEGAVASVLADILNIAGTDALLACGHAVSRRNLLSGKIGLEGRHTGIDDKKTVVIVGYKRKTLHSKMSLALKILEEHSPEFVYAAILHVYLLLRIDCYNYSKNSVPAKPPLSYLSTGNFISQDLIYLCHPSADSLRPPPWWPVCRTARSPGVRCAPAPSGRLLHGVPSP